MYFSTESCKLIVDIFCGIESICSIANLLNTQRLQSLFEFISIKERINDHRNMETKYSLLEMTKLPAMTTASTLDDQGGVNNLTCAPHARTELN